MKPADRNALEFALQIHEKHASAGDKGEVVALTLSGTEGEGVLKEAMALGADRALILSDPSFLEGEETSVATALASACQKLGAELILSGEGQVGHRVAEEMKIPSIASVFRMESEPDSLNAFTEMASGPADLQGSLPLLISILPGSNSPRIANAIKIMKASKKEVLKWTPSDLGLPIAWTGGAAGMQRVRTLLPDNP
jgi:electron transfer flavoprotein beta subunit